MTSEEQRTLATLVAESSQHGRDIEALRIGQSNDAEVRQKAALERATMILNQGQIQINLTRLESMVTDGIKKLDGHINDTKRASTGFNKTLYLAIGTMGGAFVGTMIAVGIAVAKALGMFG